MGHKLILSNSSIGSVDSVVYGGVNSNIVKNMNVEAIEEVKDDRLEESAQKLYEKDNVVEDAFPDEFELDDDVIDEGVTTNNI